MAISLVQGAPEISPSGRIKLFGVIEVLESRTIATELAKNLAATEIADWIFPQRNRFIDVGQGIVDLAKPQPALMPIEIRMRIARILPDFIGFECDVTGGIGKQ
jgi:hypothetical protein